MRYGVLLLLACQSAAAPVINQVDAFEVSATEVKDGDMLQMKWRVATGGSYVLTRDPDVVVARGDLAANAEATLQVPASALAYGVNLLRLTVFVRGARAVTDADATASPLPPASVFER